MSDKNVKDTLDFLVRALCADYARREKIISEGLADRRVDNELRYYNFKIRDAAAAVVGERMCDDFIRDIGGSVGFAHTAIDVLSESTYKKYKLMTKKNIAKALYLF